MFSTLNVGCSRKNTDRLQYRCVPSANQPASHSADSCKKYENVKNYVEEEEFIRPGTSYDPDIEAEDLNGPHRLNQAELSELVRHLDLSMQKVEHLTSRLQQ
ncbi:hypothetical protein TNCT_345751 [Trichonephila clavata]|uniref:Uncharacterized protein n=1 Tax=Trichonephila clavata TaxID=2740835 RepID=A0A8X6EX06_TRICU|nr:hypothetical protein TNCT_345751 [Trichonephila clavata]